MKVAFLTETQYQGKWPKNFLNIRTEIAWQITLDSDHFNIHNYETVKGYDVVFVIFPKATVKLNQVGCEMITSGANNDISIYSKPVIETLKKNNSLVCYIQEGNCNFFNDYDVDIQFHFYNQLAECDIIFSHNACDTHFYKGLFPQTKVAVIPSLMIPLSKTPETSIKENKVIINGNFAKWYGGFQSYIVASDFDCPIYAPSMHCKRKGEEMVPNLTHIPYMQWTDWIKHIASYKYAVSLMPIIAAGTFSLNMASWGIPCIGNMDIDTQTALFPECSVPVNDIHSARFIALQLRQNKEFYEHVSHYAYKTAWNSVYMNPEKWLEHMGKMLHG